MVTTGHTGFPVIEDGRLVGIITNRDVQTREDKEESSLTVRDIMTPAPFVIHPGDSLEDAPEIMVREDFNHLPVVEKESPDRLVGFVTRTNLMKAYIRSNHPV